MLNGHPISAKLPDDLGIGERFWYWQGASGQSYIHSIYQAGTCPPLPGAVFLAVRRLRDGRREAVAAGRFPDRWDGGGVGLDGMAEEVHVHLLARNDLAATAVLDDLCNAMSADVEVGGFSEPEDKVAVFQLELA